MAQVEDEITRIVEAHRAKLAVQITSRREELLGDDAQHQEVYQVLGIPAEECPKIDLYQNIGRFVYKYAGALLEDTTRLLLSAAGDGSTLIIPNTVSQDPLNFHIDCYTTRDNRAHEIKWRDATTDGDHVKKERNKIKSILAAGHIPVRVMYYMPVRANAERIQSRIIGAFNADGEAYVGEAAWQYVKDYSGVDLRATLLKLIPDTPRA